MSGKLRYELNDIAVASCIHNLLDSLKDYNDTLASEESKGKLTSNGKQLYYTNQMLASSVVTFGPSAVEPDCQKQITESAESVQAMLDQLILNSQLASGDPSRLAG